MKNFAIKPFQQSFMGEHFCGIIMIIKHKHHEIIANEQAKRWERKNERYYRRDGMTSYFE